MTRKHTHEDLDHMPQVSMFETAVEGDEFYEYERKMAMKPTKGIVCDASCVKGNGTKKRDGYFHGEVEWQGVDLATGKKVFTSHVQRRSTINIGELMSIIDALKHLDLMGDFDAPVYNDNTTAIAWARRRKAPTKLPLNAHTAQTHKDLKEAMGWLVYFKPKNPILKWDTDRWGECPADFGRK